MVKYSSSTVLLLGTLISHHLQLMDHDDKSKTSSQADDEKVSGPVMVIVSKVGAHRDVDVDDLWRMLTLRRKRNYEC